MSGAVTVLSCRFLWLSSVRRSGSRPVSSSAVPLAMP